MQTSKQNHNEEYDSLEKSIDYIRIQEEFEGINTKMFSSDLIIPIIKKLDEELVGLKILDITPIE